MVPNPPPLPPPLFQTTYTCLLCLRDFNTESAIRNHLQRNKKCIRRQQVQGHGIVEDVDEGDTFGTVADDPKDLSDGEPPSTRSPPTAPSPGPWNVADLDADIDDDEARKEKATAKVLITLLTSGRNKGPLPAHGQEKVLDLIHDSNFNPQDVLVKTTVDVKKFIKILVDDDDCVLTHKVINLQAYDPEQWNAKQLAVYGTSALDACVNMVKSAEAAQWLTWECPDVQDKITGPLTAARARRREAAVRRQWGEDAFYVPVTFFSDKTHLNIRGTHKAHPGFLKLCGWRLPFFYSRRAARLIVLLPVLPIVAWDPSSDVGGMFNSASSWNDHVKMRRQSLHHAALDAVLKELKAHSRYDTL